MKKIALVIPRFGKEITGGAERYAQDLVEILSQKYAVHVLTTTAQDHMTWQEVYPAGVTQEDGYWIHRFPIDIPRSVYWEKLHDLLLTTPVAHWSHGLAEEWIMQQGPYSKALLEHLNKESYEKYIFIGYLYAPTYFGVDMVERSRVWLLGTYHDEVPLYLPIFEKYRPLKHLFLTQSEKKLAQKRFGDDIQGEVIGFGLKERWQQEREIQNYVLYAGRLESGKGVDRLVEYHSKFYKTYQIPLYLIGNGSLSRDLPMGVEYKGFVSEEEKYRYMQEAQAFIHPSAYESLGIVLIEAFMMRTPALVNAASEVLSEHIQRSGGGLTFCDEKEYREHLKKLIEHRTEYALQARAYYEKEFLYDNFCKRILALL